LIPLFRIMKDVWEGRDDPGYTFPADDPDRRIDYILYSEEYRLQAAQVPDTWASDHRPVVADLVLKKYRDR
jgi:endonuclease/exonuclease/phosphatase family metal-dependent hydrolase